MNKFEKRLIKKSNGNFAIHDGNNEFNLGLYRGKTWFKKAGDSIAKSVKDDADKVWNCLTSIQSEKSNTYICCDQQVKGVKVVYKTGDGDKFSGGTACATNQVNLKKDSSTEIAQMITQMTCFGLSWISVPNCPFWNFVNTILRDDTLNTQGTFNVNQNALCFETPNGESTSQLCQSCVSSVTETTTYGQTYKKQIPKYNIQVNTSQIVDSIAVSKIDYVCYGCDGVETCIPNLGDGNLTFITTGSPGTYGVYVSADCMDPLMDTVVNKIKIDPITKKKTNMPYSIVDYNKFSKYIRYVQVGDEWNFSFQFIESRGGASSITNEPNDTGIVMMSPYAFNLKNSNLIKGISILSTISSFLIYTNYVEPVPTTNHQYVIALGQAGTIYLQALSKYFTRLSKDDNYQYSPSENRYKKLLNQDLQITVNALKKYQNSVYEAYYLFSNTYSLWLQSMDCCVMFIFYILMHNAKSKNIDFKTKKFQYKFYRYISNDFFLKGCHVNNFKETINTYYNYLNEDLIDKNYDIIINKFISAIIRTQDSVIQILMSYVSKKFTHEEMMKNTPYGLAEIVFGNVNPIRKQFAFYKENLPLGFNKFVKENNTNFLKFNNLPAKTRNNVLTALKSIKWNKILYYKFCRPRDKLICNGWNLPDETGSGNQISLPQNNNNNNNESYDKNKIIKDYTEEFLKNIHKFKQRKSKIIKQNKKKGNEKNNK